MTTTLRVVLDAPAAPGDAPAEAARQLARALVRTAPPACEVAAVVPAIADDEISRLHIDVPGLADVAAAPLPRRELAASWQLGVAAGVAGGMIHSPTFLAPLVRHDRVYAHEQTVVTLWDLTAWEAPEELGRAGVMWQKAMLKRAVKHADAVVVPSHAHADALRQVAPKLGDRIRVIAGAAPEGFAAPTDEVGRRRSLELPGEYVVIDGAGPGAEIAFAGVMASGADLPVVVMNVPDDRAAAIREAGAAAGLDESRLRVPGPLTAADRAAVLAGATALVSPSTVTGFPWAVVEALTLSLPVVVADTPANRELVVDGGALAQPSADAIGEALSQLLGSDAARSRAAVLAGDRGRAFSWAGAAERVWQLHADL
ncbi:MULTISPECIES: glycosyltransferase [Microbacterium]|uniref:glycosyltransferase n=1 Tax=Microbacterium TaxID=33882 RepID=UPI00214AF29D|nr:MULTISPECIES: glycosyltransferase [unclassified Microbacterium]MCR2813615.1 glycosyltransferase [Microbacterium sp. zg.Y1084]MDL5486570.1 glycosyltransferase [Microbacterium sp. zg-Y1211]